MSNYQNLGEIQTLKFENKNQIALKIELKQTADCAFQKCYQKAIAFLGVHTSCRGSGAPVVDHVSFEGEYAITTRFPNSQVTLNDAKEFLEEFDKIVGIAYGLYDEQKNRLAREKELEQQKSDERQKEIEELNEFFNK